MSHINFKGKKLINSLTTIPLVLPSILVVIGFVICFGNNGILNKFLMMLTGVNQGPLRILYSFKAIILAHTFYNFPISLRLISSGWQKIGKNRIEAAESLGASKVRTFLTVSFPAILPSIIASASLIFIFCFMSFAVILILGGDPAFTTIEVEIYRLARTNVDVKAASSLALIGAILTTIFIFLYIKFQNKLNLYSIKESPQKKLLFKKLAINKKILIIVYLIFVIMLIAGPLVAILARSFQTRIGWRGEVIFSLKQYLNIIRSPSAISSIKNTLKFSFSSLLISMPAGFIASYFIARKKVIFPATTETLFMLPMGVSSIVLGLGYYAIISNFENLHNSGLLIIFAHSAISLPFIIRTLTTAIKTIPQSLAEASSTLGASRFKTIVKVEIPILSDSIISAIAFAFCISAGEINSVIILSDNTSATIPIIIYRFVSSYNFFGACAMGVILMGLCGISFYAIEKKGGIDLF